MSAEKAAGPEEGLNGDFYDSGLGAVWLRLKAAQNRIPVIQLVALVAVFAYGSATLPGLATWSSMTKILVFASLIGLASIGQTMLILMGGFDLSVSGIIVASGLVVTVLKDKYHWSFLLALLVAVVASGILGACAGQICHRLRIQPLIVTLAVGAIAVGLLQAQTGGVVAGSAPQWLLDLTSPATKTFGFDLPPLVAIWAVAAILMALFLHRTSAGRKVLATGANSRAAEYSLISTRRVTTAAFAFSGIMSALVGVLIAGFNGTVDGTAGDPYLFQSVVAVIIGGTVFGGPGDYTWTVVGALLITVIDIVVIGHGATEAVQEMIYGAAILVSVGLYGRTRRLRDRI
jgi:ribose transport system permease protein